MGKNKFLAIFLTVTFVMFGFICMYLAFGCRYSGKEFSPDDFTIRNFSYRYEPITGTVISGRVFSTDIFDSMPDLIGDKYIKPVYKKEKTWHLTEDNGYYFNGASVDSDARFLVNFLSLRDDNSENKWTVWNSENPKSAKVLWPLIADMARDEMYLVVGDVLSFVLEADVSEPKEFQAELQQEIAKAYLKLGKIDFENNDLESAKARISKSIKYDSTDKANLLLNRVNDSIAYGDSLLEAEPE